MELREIQALQKKHHQDADGLCAGCGSRTLDGGTSTIAWENCDVRRLLAEVQRLNTQVVALSTSLNNWRNEALSGGDGYELEDA